AENAQGCDVVGVAVLRDGVALVAVPRERAGRLRERLQEREREVPGAGLLRRCGEAVGRPRLEVRRVDVSREGRGRGPCRRSEGEDENGDERETLHWPA